MNLRIVNYLFACILLSSCNKQETTLKPPNILFILADDLGYHDLGITGSQFYETPNIDRIGENGVQFTNGYATCQVCSPSRASIMTGKYPARLGITDWIGAKTGVEWRENNRHDKLIPVEYNHQLPLEDTTLAEALKENGYKTFFAGKWHLGGEGSYPEDHGFEINIGGWSPGSPHGGFFSPWENPRIENHEAGENLSIRLANETADFIKTNKDSTFFAFLSFYAVHAPIQTTKEKWRKYRDKADSLEIAESGYGMERVLPIRRVQDNPIYAGLLETMDEAVGIVIKALEDAGVADNTIVIFTSDNGGVASGDAYATANLPLRGGKGYQWEGGIREPYFIWVPGMEADTIETPVTGTDFYPTILDFAGIPLNPDQHMDGVSLAPLMKGESIYSRELYWHYPHYGNQGGEPSTIIRDGDWKMIRYWEGGRNELYNLVIDPSEQTDLAEEKPEIVAKLMRKLERWMYETKAKIPLPDPMYDSVKRRLRLEKIINESWQELENGRLRVLSEEYDPGNQWWGSDVSNQ